MLKLRKILLLDTTYIILLLIVFVITLLRLNIKRTSIYNNKTKSVNGNITEIIKTNEYIKIKIKSNKSNEYILGYYYLTNNKTYYNLKLNDYIKIYGIFNKPKNSTTKNTFDYKKNLENNNIYYIVQINKIKILKQNNNLFYHIKQFIINRLNNNKYLYCFILGNKDLISQDMKKIYQNIGISHLFAISGMHISLLSSLIQKLLKKLKIEENKRYFITIIILSLYGLITGFSASVLRGILFYIVFSINRIFYFYIKNYNLFIIVLCISILYNPKFLLMISFYYSFIISISLIIMSEYLSKGNYIIKLLKTSFISFIISLPISIYNFYQINILSILFNLICVPIVSIIIFPLSLICTIFSFLIPLYNILTNLLELIATLFNKLSIFTFIIYKPNIFIIIIYYILIIILFIGINRKQNKLYIPIIILIIINILYKNNNSYIEVLDVGQGDSILLHSNSCNILIDTGGKKNYNKTNNYNITNNITIPYLKSQGINKINYLLLSHGDYDHLGEAINLINNFKIKKIYINMGNINYLEKKIIKNHNNVKTFKQNDQIICDNFTIVQINKEFNEENDSSSIYYIQFNKIKMLFMGDASIKSEEYIIKKYNLPKIDILKVGHHGSDTSTSISLIKTIKPKICLISVGKDNKYGHPKKEVLNKIKKYCKIYRTDLDGTIEIKLNDN